MATSYSTLLGLALPVQGELSGTWGDAVNDYITEYLDSAIAGVQTISGTQTSVALSQTNGSTLVSAGAGATGSSQYMVINCTGTPSGLLTISAPNTSKVYVVINATAQSVKLVGVTGPTSGVTLVTGEKAVCAWNGSDFVKVATSVADGVTTIDFGSTGLTPNTATSGAVTVAGTLAIANGGTNSTATATAGGVGYGTGTAHAYTAASTGGYILTSGGASAPAFIQTLPVANGGTGLTSGTSGGVLAYTASGTLASSGALTASALVLGGGAGVAPTPMGSLGTTTTVLHGNAGGAPTFGAVSLTADVSGALPAANGGTGVANNAASTLTISGAFATTLTVSGTTGVTLPTTGTLATLAGSETLSNKTLTAPALGTPASGVLSACTVDGTNKVGYLNIPQSGSAKVASYTLVVGDVGKFVVLGTSGLVVVPASIFAVGDAISVANNTAAAITCTSSAVTAYLGGTNTVVTSFSLASRGVCTILYVTASVVFITGNVS